MTPHISIIIPCYNQGKFLSETLQSVLEQKYQSWECIMVNDGSSDNTEEIALQWVEKDKRFRYLYKENSGVADTRNLGIKEAKGEYIFPLDGDDRVGPEFIEKALGIFDLRPEVKLVYSDLILFGDGIDGFRVSPLNYNYQGLFTENQISVSAIFRKADFLKTPGYNPNMTDGLEDWDFWLSFLHEEDVVIKLEGFHVFYRIKAISRSNINTQKEKNDAMLLQIFKNHVPLFLKYFNPIRDRIEADYYKKEVQSYQSSAEYKWGRVILYPFRLLQKIYRRLFS